MFVDKIGDVLALMQLQRALAEFGTGSIFAALLFGLTVVLAVDYARMLYLHFKMVSPLQEKRKGKKN
jgi:formate hydrogenlyase subunit 4